MNKRILSTALVAATAAAFVVGFQNCGQVSFSEAGQSVADGTNANLDTTSAPPLPPPVDVCANVSCTLDPLTEKPSVVTVLIALGDEANSQLVVNGGSSQLIAETAVRYASPKDNPKILLVLDRGRGSESVSDSVYVDNVLLKRYDVTPLEEPASGLRAADLAGYDVVWFNNPGAPMSDSRTRDALIAFAGGVILQGDDLSRGTNFDNSALTGLQYLDNGVAVRCDGVDYRHDNNGDERYRVALNSSLFSSANATSLAFEYGNDIDNTVPARPDLQIIATAQGGPAACTALRPAIVRYIKN